MLHLLADHGVADRLTWAPGAHDVPVPRAPMMAKVELAAAPHRRLLAEVAGQAPELTAAIAEQLVGRCPAERATRLVAGVVTVRAALVGTPVDADGALRWFMYGHRPKPAWEGARMPGRWDSKPGEELRSLLPYVLDPFGLTTRRAMLSGRGRADERSSRKRIGAFYTPGDVARSLAEDVVGTETTRVLDPACGAGVFLRAAFTQLAQTLPPQRAVRRLFGVDVDPYAIDACALVLVHDWLMREPLDPDESPRERFDAVRRQLVCADALALFADPAQQDLLAATNAGPGCHLPATFDAVLMNPPFATIGAMSENVRLGYASLRAARNPGGVNLVWPFWELAARATTPSGRAGTVLPLSVAYLDDDVARAGRGEVFGHASWEMRYFDRAPDALFGDDVKQRIALALKRPGPAGFVRTFAMRRWSADGRAAALRFADGEGVVGATAKQRLLKIGSEREQSLLSELRSAGSVLGDMALRARLTLPSDLAADDCAIAVAPTAYNWIGVYRRTDVARVARAHAAGKLAELTFASPALADAAYAVLASRVYLWWWRATGDLFHVPLSAVTQAPFGLKGCSEDNLLELGRSGRDCWQAALQAPVTAVNRSIKTVAYTPAADTPALDAVDDAVARALGLSHDVVRFVSDDARRLRVAGRSR